MFTVQTLLDGVKSLLHHAFLEADSGHCAPSLRLDEYLSFLVFMRTYLAAEIVIGAEIPVSVPTMLLHSLNHIIDKTLSTGSLLGMSEMTAELDIVTSADHEESCNHK